MTKTHNSIFMGLFTSQAILIAQLSSPRRQPCKVFPEITLYFGQFMIVLTDKF